VANCNRVLLMHEGSVIREYREKDMQKEGVADELQEIISNPDSFATSAGKKASS
jgi:ABC-type Na+ transport system ATPase subunit NatA